MATIQPKGLKGLKGIGDLSKAEYDAFVQRNQAQIASHNYDPVFINQLYSNKQFIDKYGLDAFKAMPDATARYNLMHEDAVNEAVEAAYKPQEKNGQILSDTGAGDQWDKIQQLSTSAKEKLLNSEWKTPEQLKKEKDARTSWWEKGIDFVAGEAIQRYKQDSNQKILDKIYNDDADAAASNGKLAPIINQAYLSKDITGYDDEDTKRKFVTAITPDYNKGNRGISAYAANYGDGSEGQIAGAMEDFSIDEMRQVLAKKAVYDRYLSPEMATTALNNEAMRYIKNHQGSLKRLGLFGRDVLIAAASYTADKINGINNLLLMAEDKASGMPTVYVDDASNIVDTTKNTIYRSKDGSLFYKDADGKNHTVHQQQIARTTLHNMGKKEDGSDEGEGFFHLNPVYWTRAEQFGTLDADKQKQYEKLGSSPYKVAYDPNDDSDLVYESFKMMSFGIADAASMLIPFGVGAAGKALSTASKAGKVAQGFGKALNTTGRYLGAQTKIGSTVQGLAGAGGIAYAYQRGAFQETLAQNLAKAEETALNASKNDIYNSYQNDKEFKRTTDMAIAARAAELKDAYIAQNSREGNQVIDSPELNQMLHDKAQEQILGEMVQKRFDERKQSDEYAALQQRAIDGAGDAATATFIPEAIKYGLVNTIGFRKFWYSNPQKMAKQAAKNFKGLGEVTTEAGKKRLAVTPRYATMKAKAKAAGKIAASQFWGGAWTNGTDDMMVDAAERINEDSFDKYTQAYLSGEALADVYGLGDGLYSYWKGLQNSMGQETTYRAAAVGGFGSLVSATPNMANIAHLATKEGREAFKEAYQQRPVYEVVDGIKTIKRDESGKPIMENVSWTDNWRERANFFIQNGVLNNYYAKKASEREFQEHADYINEFLDKHEGDFGELSQLVAADIALDESEDVRDVLTNRFIKALLTVKSLNSMANKSNDPTSLSSVITNIKGMIDKATNGQLTEEEAANEVAQYYAQHPGLEQSEANNQIALEHIMKNAKDLKEAVDVYDMAETQAQKVEKALGRKIGYSVREDMKLSQALVNHWRKRIGSMKEEIGDTSDSEAEMSQEKLLPYFGGWRNAGLAVIAYAKQEAELRDALAASHRDTMEQQEAYEEAQKKLEEATTSDEKYNASIAVSEARAKLEAAQQEEIFINNQMDKTISRKNALNDALKAAKEDESPRILTADEIFALPAVERAQMLNPQNRNDYSKEQVAEIEKLETRLINKEGDALQKIQDISLLTREIARKEDAYTRMAQHPEAAAAQLEKQKEAAANRAYEIINKRNAQTLAEFTKELDEKVAKDPDNTDRGLVAFHLLKHYKPQRLEEIKKDNLLPEFEQQINDALEWSKLASDVDAEVEALVAVPDWKRLVSERVFQALESSVTEKEMMKNLETMLDTVDSDQLKQSVERILQGLDSKGHLRDTLVIENRKQRLEREEAAKKKLEEDKKREEEAKKAAEEAAAKEKVTVENSPKAGELKTGEEVDLGTGEKASEPEGKPSETVAEEAETEESEEKPVEETQKPVWAELVNGLMEDDAEDGSVDTVEMWTGLPKSPKESILTVKRETLGKVPTITFNVDGVSEIMVVPAIDRVATKDAQEKTKDWEDVSELPFNVKSLSQIEDKWYLEGTFAGHEGTTVTFRTSNTFDLARTIENNQAAREAEVVASGIDTSNPNLIDEGEQVRAESPDIAQQAKEAGIELGDTTMTETPEEVNRQGEQTADEQLNTLSGTAMPIYDRETLSEKNSLVRKVGDKPNDSRNRFNEWAAAFVDKNGVIGIKLDEIVSTELSQVLKADPHTKVKFMCTPADVKYSPDGKVGSHLFLVIDYDSTVAKIHKKENGGVVENEGNKYLIIGVVGYGNPEHKDPAKAAVNKSRRDNWYNNVFGAGSHNRGLQNGRKKYFDEHPGERFRIFKDKEGQDVTTEIILRSLTPGYLVKLLEGEKIPTYRKLSEILADENMNPNKLTLTSLKWGIQELTQFLPINELSANIMPPRSVERNSGNVFVLIPAGNGKFIPSFIHPLKYAEMRDGKLARRVEDLLVKLTTPGDKYPIRLSALNELLRIFHFNKERTNILLGKPGINNITFVYKDDAGIEHKTTFKLDATFDSQKFNEFKEAFRAMNPRVNITAKALISKTRLEELDEAGALTTDCALMHSMGSTFAIYPVDANGVMITPPKDSGAPYRESTEYVKTRQQVLYKGQEYYYNADKKEYTSSRDGQRVDPDSREYESLEYNRRIAVGELLPVKSEQVCDYYILDNGEHPLVIKVEKIGKEVTKLSEDASRELINKIAEEKAHQAREESASDALKKAKKSEDIDLEGTNAAAEVEKEQAPEVAEQAETAQPEEKGKIVGSGETAPTAPVEKPRETFTSPENQAATQDFKTLAKNKKYKRRLIQEISNKWDDAPVKLDAQGTPIRSASVDTIIDFLKQKGVNTEVIGTTDADIEAWIHTEITCK